VSCFLIGGDLKERIERMEPAIVECAKALGCTRVAQIAGKGWGRVLAPLDCRSALSVMIRDLHQCPAFSIPISGKTAEWTSGLLGPSAQQSTGLLTPALDSDAYSSFASAALTGLLELAAGQSLRNGGFCLRTLCSFHRIETGFHPAIRCGLARPPIFMPTAIPSFKNRRTTGGLQPIDPSIMKPGKNMGEAHVPLPPIPAPLFRFPMLPPPVPFMVLAPEMSRLIVGQRAITAMNGVPANFDSRSFIGRTLEMICFAAYRFNLHFGHKPMIQVNGDYSL
jgi:hypothetical protein